METLLTLLVILAGLPALAYAAIWLIAWVIHGKDGDNKDA